MFAAVEIDFNCMGVFVPEERAVGVGTVHLLMPDTSGHTRPDPQHPHADGDADGVEPHVLRMYHGRAPAGVDMDGWALDFARGMADTGLRPVWPSPEPADVVNLSALTHRGVSREMIGSTPPVPLAGRISFGMGGTWRTAAEAWWRIGGERIRMAHRLVWRIEGLVPDADLPWTALRGQTGPPPLRSLADTGPDDNGVYRFSIYHVPPSSLPPDPYGAGQLEPDEVRAHFAALYRLVGTTDPDPSLLPERDGGTGGKVNCGIAQARFA